MPFKWSKKTDRVPVSPERMKRAAKEVATEGCKLRTTAKKYAIDKMTLRRYVEKFRRNGEEETFIPNFNTGQIFTDQQEKLLGEYLLTAANMNYGLTTKETRELAYQFGNENGAKLPQNWHKKNIATYDWLRGFMNRNSYLSLRIPEPTSLSRATAFNKSNVKEFFNLLREAHLRVGFEPEAIYNCDETGVQTAHKPRKIISKNGQKQVSKVTSAERGSTVTICCAANAVGNSVPPFFIFPRQNIQDYMTSGAPPGSQVATHKSGWMTEENFEKYLLHFIKFTKCSTENKILLILDNHRSHMSPNGLQLCKTNGITLLTLPPHTSHKLQPLDVSVYGPFKSYFNQASDNFMVTRPGETISLKNIATLVGEAHPRAFTPSNITKGFATTGIYPFNPNIFSDSDFLCSSVTDRIIIPPEEDESTVPDISITNLEMAGPSTSEIILRTPEKFPIMPNNINAFKTSLKTPEELRPFPKALPRKKQGGRKPVKTKILTDTPNMEEIKENFARRQEKKDTKNVKKRVFSEKEKKQSKKKQKVISDDSDSETSIVPSSNSSDITDIGEQLMNESEEENFVNGIIAKEDFVLVKFASKKTVKHYVGQVLDIESNGDYYVNFMRRTCPGDFFVFPEVQDTAVVYSDDAVKLPAPSHVGGTARVNKQLKFHINFQKYENVN